VHDCLTTLLIGGAIQIPLGGAHFNFLVHDRTRGKGELNIFHGPSENEFFANGLVLLLDDEFVIGIENETCEGDEVLDGVEDGRTGNDPPNGRFELANGDVRLGFGVADLVALVEDDAVPREHVEFGRGNDAFTGRGMDIVEPTTVNDHTIGCDGNLGIGTLVRVRSVVDGDREVGRELLDFGFPLGNDGFGPDDEGPIDGIGDDSRNDLDGFTEPHFVTEKATGGLGVGFAFGHPTDAIPLVGIEGLPKGGHF